MPRRGEENHNAKIPDHLVREIRKTWTSWKKAGSDKGYTALAEAFGLSKWTLRDIVTYRTRIDA